MLTTWVGCKPTVKPLWGGANVDAINTTMFWTRTENSGDAHLDDKELDDKELDDKEMKANNYDAQNL
ncbi:MAG: hypothetical protein AAFY20_14540 [Cyanobacteria bacterium J06639_14]